MTTCHAHLSWAGEAAQPAAALAVALALAVDLPGPLRSGRAGGEEPEGRRAWMRGVRGRDRMSLPRIPAGHEDPERIARRARRRGVLSFGYFSLHKQRKVTRARQGVKRSRIAPIGSAKDFDASFEEDQIKAFAPLRGTTHLSLLLQRNVGQRKHTPGLAPCAALRVHATDGNFSKAHPVPSKNAAHPCASPLRGLTHRRRRYGWGPDEAKSKSWGGRSSNSLQSKSNSPLACGHPT